MDYFLELFGHLPRAGPGDQASTRKAFRMTKELPPASRILDVGCGPGMQTVDLAEISGGHVVALDNLPLMLERVRQTALQAGLTDQIEPCLEDMCEMKFDEESFDVIWSEAAIYILGFRKGLEAAGIRPALMACDLYYLNQGVDRPMCCGVWLDWNPC